MTRSLRAPCRAAAVVSLVLATTACSFFESTESNGDRLDSNGPQTDRWVSSIVRFDTPPLLDTATPNAAGVMVVDQAAATAIANEQNEFLANMAKRAPQARLLYKFRLVLNGVAIVAPRSVLESLRSLRHVSSIDEGTIIAPPQEMPSDEESEGGDLKPRAFEQSSVKWIGALTAKEKLGLTGKNVSVGVIDTGIDYTHAMFGGPGTTAAYQANQPGVIEPGTFPTQKVVGGADFVGETYDSGSLTEENRIPKPDADPIDKRGHGTHVAGTVGGVGDEVNTYDGVAPDVKLHALKVFGNGSTSEAPVFAALEYSADPNGDLDLSDRLDVVNLSLGSGFGTNRGLYNRVVTSLSRGGTMFVAAAGNSGATRYIVGSPSSVDEAISVAASTDNMNGATPDLLVGFSSWGPRSLDAMIKPEVAAPGSNILSARVGGGNKGSKKSGTSMASPHVAGVAALLRQAHPKATPAELKSLMMNSGIGMKDRNGKPYAVSKVGAGRVQTYEAAVSPIVFDPPAISLGFVDGNGVTSGTRTVKVTNISNTAVHSAITWRSTDGLKLSGPASIDVPANGSATVEVGYRVDVSNVSLPEAEVEGFVAFGVPAHGDVPAITLQIPALAVATRGSDVTVTPKALASGPVSLELVNRGPLSGDALAFNMIARDATGSDGTCDLAAAGYRIVKNAAGTELLQVGMSLAHRLSTWNFCELDVLIDENGDGVPEQEIGGTFDKSLRAPGGSNPDSFGSYLIDAPKMRAIRAQIEQGTAQATAYPSSVIDEQPFVRFPLSSIGYVSADLSKLKRTASGKLRIKVGALPAIIGADDYLDIKGGQWIEIDPAQAPYTNMMEKVSVAPGASTPLTFTSTGTDKPIIVFLPHNSDSSLRSLLISATGQLSP